MLMQKILRNAFLDSIRKTMNVPIEDVDQELGINGNQIAFLEYRDLMNCLKNTVKQIR
ncbi:MAG: hypothetical protein CM15mP127_03740 [Gammaproteobacteria bacterium]|nr:MAG: hypothetical protein CM15mP127_03740 [Gammaproteobacteria bacterium]